jgi:hypothetical protein
MNCVAQVKLFFAKHKGAPSEQQVAAFIGAMGDPTRQALQQKFKFDRRANPALEAQWESSTGGQGGKLQKAALFQTFIMSKMDVRAPAFSTALASASTSTSKKAETEWVPMEVMKHRYGDAELKARLEAGVIEFRRDPEALGFFQFRLSTFKVMKQETASTATSVSQQSGKQQIKDMADALVMIGDAAGTTPLTPLPAELLGTLKVKKNYNSLLDMMNGEMAEEEEEETPQVDATANPAPKRKASAKAQGKAKASASASSSKSAKAKSKGKAKAQPKASAKASATAKAKGKAKASSKAKAKAKSHPKAGSKLVKANLDAHTAQLAADAEAAKHAAADEAGGIEAAKTMLKLLESALAEYKGHASRCLNLLWRELVSWLL